MLIPKSIGMLVACHAFEKSHISRGIICYPGFDLAIVQLGDLRSQKEPRPNLKFLLPKVMLETKGGEETEQKSLVPPSFQGRWHLKSWKWLLYLKLQM